MSTALARRPPYPIMVRSDPDRTAPSRSATSPSDAPALDTGRLRTCLQSGPGALPVESARCPARPGRTNQPLDAYQRDCPAALPAETHLCAGHRWRGGLIVPAPAAICLLRATRCAASCGTQLQLGFQALLFLYQAAVLLGSLTLLLQVGLEPLVSRLWLRRPARTRAKPPVRLCRVCPRSCSAVAALDFLPRFCGWLRAAPGQRPRPGRPR